MIPLIIGLGVLVYNLGVINTTALIAVTAIISNGRL